MSRLDRNAASANGLKSPASACSIRNGSSLAFRLRYIIVRTASANARSVRWMSVRAPVTGCLTQVATGRFAYFVQHSGEIFSEPRISRVTGGVLIAILEQLIEPQLRGFRMIQR